MRASQEIEKQLDEGFDNFEKNLRGYFSKEIAPKDWKGVGGGFGSYAERGFETAMLRLRFAGGAINRDQMKYLVHAVKEFDLKYVHFTTGECIQFHHLDADTILKLYRGAFEHGIYSRGTGGDNVRNVTASPLRGVQKNEYFNVNPYIKEAAKYGLSLVGKLKLPRKYKIGFSSGDNEGHANFKDLGFLAKENGKFDVYAGGGIGGGSRFAVKVMEDVNPSDILYHIHGMGQLYSEHGNYKSRASARSRFIAKELGEEEFRKLYAEYLAKSFETQGDLTVNPPEEVWTKQGDGKATSPLAKEQKQEGLYYIHYKPLVGTPSIDVFVELFDYVGGLEDTEIRICADESIYIINLTGSEADHVAKIVESTNAKNPFEHSVACVGATICQIGFQDSSGMIGRIKKTLEEQGISTDHLPQLHASGCLSSCGTHQIGKLGFHGFTKLVDKKPQPAFKLFINGNYQVGSERMSDELGVITVEDLPKFFIDLANELNAKDQDYDVWYAENPERLVELAKPYL